MNIIIIVVNAIEFNKPTKRLNNAYLGLLNLIIIVFYFFFTYFLEFIRKDTR